MLSVDINDKSTTCIGLAELKKSIPGARLKNVNNSIKKIMQLQQLNLPTKLFATTNRKLLLKYHDRVMALSPSNIHEAR